jgi:hypothetical protein
MKSGMIGLNVADIYALVYVTKNTGVYYNFWQGVLIYQLGRIVLRGPEES